MDTSKANCIDKDPNLFFPENVFAQKYSIMLAKAICQSCEIRTECLQTALDNNEYGIWGGTTDEERKRLRRKLRITVR